MESFCFWLASRQVPNDLGVDRATVTALPDFDEPATYRLGSGGWLRKHVGWNADSDSDEDHG